MICAPIVEEALFRGAVLRGLLSKMARGAGRSASRPCCSVLAHFDPDFGRESIGLIIALSVAGVGLGLGLLPAAPARAGDHRPRRDERRGHHRGAELGESIDAWSIAELSELHRGLEQARRLGAIGPRHPPRAPLRRLRRAQRDLLPAGGDRQRALHPHRRRTR